MVHHPRLPLLLALALLAGAPASARAGEPAPGRPPPADIGGVTETLHGREVKDPYRGLESRETGGAWLDAEQAKSVAWFAAHSDEALDQRLDALTRIPRASSPRVVGGSTFYVENDGDREQGLLRVKEGSETRTLLDPNLLDATGKTSLDGWDPSVRGKYLAYLVSKDGTEDSVLHVLEVAGAKDTGLTIPDCRWSSISWLPDDSGFYYTRYPAGARYGQTIWLHLLGQDASKDVELFGKGRDPTDFPYPLASEDGTHVAFAIERGWSATDLYLQDRATGKTVTLAQGRPSKLWPVRVEGGIVWALTNEGAPRFRLVRIDPLKAAPEAWKDVVPEGVLEGGKQTIDSASYAKGAWVLATHDEDAVQRLYVVAASGGAPREVSTGPGALGAVSTDPRECRVAFGFSSFSSPPSALEFDTEEPAPKARRVAGFEGRLLERELVVKRVHARSYDGTSIPMWVAYKQGTEKSFPAPTLLTGYGGFASSEDPGFSTMALAWMERGGVYALANLRGGNEFGETWHQAGMRDKKFQVFEDFEASMRWLHAAGISKPATLGITGGSNGGLLMGAMMTRCPEQFGACVGAVGLYDMVRFHLWPPAELWTDEYGSAENPEQIGFLLGYSPYHHVTKGIRYPAFLGTTAEQDTRVSWKHTAKFVAALQNAQVGDAPILFFLETKAGHGQGKNRSDRVKDLSRTLRFVRANLGP